MWSVFISIMQKSFRPLTFSLIAFSSSACWLIVISFSSIRLSNNMLRFFHRDIISAAIWNTTRLSASKVNLMSNLVIMPVMYGRRLKLLTAERGLMCKQAWIETKSEMMVMVLIGWSVIFLVNLVCHDTQHDNLSKRWGRGFAKLPQRWYHWLISFFIPHPPPSSIGLLFYPSPSPSSHCWILNQPPTPFF